MITTQIINTFSEKKKKNLTFFGHFCKLQKKSGGGGGDFQNCQNVIDSTPPAFHLSEKSKSTEIQTIRGHNFPFHGITHLLKETRKRSEITTTATFYLELKK